MTILTQIGDTKKPWSRKNLVQPLSHNFLIKNNLSKKRQTAFFPQGILFWIKTFFPKSFLKDISLPNEKMSLVHMATPHFDKKKPICYTGC